MPGDKSAAKAKVKVGPPNHRSKKKSTTAAPKPSPQQTQPSKPTDSATATVQRIFSNAKNKFLPQRQERPEATASSAGASTSSEHPADPLASPRSVNDHAEEDGGASDDSEAESANLSDVDGNAVSQAGSESESESESDAEDATPAIQPAGLEPKPAGKGKEKEASAQASNAKVAVKIKKVIKPARFGQLVFVPIVPEILPGTKLPTLPLPTPHDIRSLRQAKLTAAPPAGESTFSISGKATNDEVDRLFRTILPKPFKFMGKGSKYHLMYGHGNLLGGCGTDSPTGFDISTAYRAGIANFQKVLYIAPVKPIPDETIKSWSVDAVVAAINRRFHGKKRKRSVSSESAHEDGYGESDSESAFEDGSETGSDATSSAGEDIAATSSADVGSAEEDPDVVEDAPPRKKLKIGTSYSATVPAGFVTNPVAYAADSGKSSSKNSGGAAHTSTAHNLESSGSSRVLRERNRPLNSSNTVTKHIDPLNPWLNPSSYVL
ncbi:hypothetical protein FRC00_004973 [Tulasnella sp. 408]|nr:hypothetical protein FRC00_004973 [Tulasnella sp. 408]